MDKMKGKGLSKMGDRWEKNMGKLSPTPNLRYSSNNPEELKKNENALCSFIKGHKEKQ